MGVPLYPVAMILLFRTMMAPTASLMQPALSFSTLQIEMKYESKSGLKGLKIFFLFSVLRKAYPQQSHDMICCWS